MNPIGGFFELELQKGKEFYSGLLALNTGRNALEYILKANQYIKVYIPFFTCDVLLEPFKKLNIAYSFYHVNEALEIAEPISPAKGEAILYTNYFGIKDAYIKSLSKSHENLIIDNAQAFYSAALPGVNTFYSCRKFFGVPDGAYVQLKSGTAYSDVSEQDQSAARMSHLIGRIENGAEQAYAEFKKNDQSLVGMPVLNMSAMTKELMCSIDYASAKKIRNENFLTLHNALKSNNLLNCIQTQEIDCPMIYPFLIKKEGLKEKLIANKVFVATYWPNVGEWCKEKGVEKTLYNYLIALPVDQRYSTEEMKRIIQLIQE